MSQMTHKEFCCWLEGFFMRGGEEPTAEQWHEIGKRLQKTMNPAVNVGEPVSTQVRRHPLTSKECIERFSNADATKDKAKESTELAKRLLATSLLTLSPIFESLEESSPKPVKRALDECEQGEIKKDFAPITTTIGDMAREALRYVPPFTPQPPFVETHGVERGHKPTC